MREATREFEHRLPVRGFADGCGQLIGLYIFEQVGDRAGAHGREDVFILVVRGDHDHLRFGSPFADVARGCNAVELTGHLEVHQDDVGLKLFNGGQGRFTGIGFGDHLDVGQRVQKGAHPLANDLVIIYEQDFDWHKTLHWRSSSPERSRRFLAAKSKNVPRPQVGINILIFSSSWSRYEPGRTPGLLDQRGTFYKL